MVTEALWFLSVSIIPYVFRDSITRVYYSFNDSKTPFIVAFSSIVLKYVLNVIFIKYMKLGIGGITLSTSLVTLFNAVVLGILIGRKIKLNYKSLFVNLSKMIVAGTITFVSCELSIYLLNKYTLLKGFTSDCTKIITIIFLCIFVYTGLNLLFKMEYASELFKRIKDKL